MSCFALLDTGANISCINDQLAVDLGLQLIDRRPIDGVGGTNLHNVYMGVLFVPSLQFQKYGELYSVDIRAHKMILGRDFLKEVILLYDGREGKITVCR